MFNRFSNVFLLVVFFSITGLAQSTFNINSYYDDENVWINGREYVIDRVGEKIVTNYPEFDTIAFLDYKDGLKNKVICNFKPDSCYSIIYACCGSRDLVPSYKLENDNLNIWSLDDFDKRQRLLMEEPFISIKLLNETEDSIYAWHADAACFTESKRIGIEKWELGIPPKCFYWNNITTISFYLKDIKSENDTDDDFVEEFIGVKNLSDLNSLSFRLFDNEKVLLVYDYKQNKIKIEYE